MCNPFHTCKKPSCSDISISRLIVVEVIHLLRKAFGSHARKCFVNLTELIQPLRPFDTPKINHGHPRLHNRFACLTLVLILNRKVGNCWRSVHPKIAWAESGNVRRPGWEPHGSGFSVRSLHEPAVTSSGGSRHECWYPRAEAQPSS